MLFKFILLVLVLVICYMTYQWLRPKLAKARVRNSQVNKRVSEIEEDIWYDSSNNYDSSESSCSDSDCSSND